MKRGLDRILLNKLKKRVEEAGKKKKELEDYLKKLHYKYSKGEITYSFYVETLYNKFEGRDIGEWIEHYENYIKELKRKIIREEKRHAIKNFLLLVLSSIALVFLINVGVHFSSNFAGFAIFQGNQNQIFSDSINSSFNQSQIYNWVPKNQGTLNFVNVSGTFNGTGYAEVYLGNLLISNISQNGEFNVCEQTCNLTESDLNQTSYFLQINLTNTTLYIDNIPYSIQNYTNSQGNLTANQTTASPITSTNKNESKINISQKQIKNGEEIKVSSQNNAHYKNITLSANISDSFNVKNPSRIKVYWVENNSYVTPSSVTSASNNGIYDKVTWIAPDLFGNQTYIIIITDAQWLDSNRSFIEDVYNDTYALDNLWTPTIPDGNFIRATFAENLTSSNDMILFLKIISGNPIIKVYEANQSKVVATFEPLKSNKFNSALLTNLTESQDTFDLEVMGGSIQIDYIVDPTKYYYFNTIYYISTASTTENINTNFTANCVVTSESGGQSASSAQTGHTYIQWNTSTIAQKNATASTGVSGDYVNINGSNPDTVTTPTTTSTNVSAAVHKVNFNQTGVYNLWCFEPSESADNNNGGMTSSIVTYTAVTTSNISIILNSPANTYNSSSSSVSFNGTVNSANTVSNVSIFTNISGSWTANQTNTSGVTGEYDFTVAGIPDGIYLWNYQSCDITGVCNFSSSNRTLTIDTTPPTITLPVYANATEYRNTQNMIFNISAVDSGVGAQDCVINVGGSTNQTVTVNSGWCNGTYSLSGISDGNQTINAYANDSVGNTGLNNSYVVC